MTARRCRPAFTLLEITLAMAMMAMLGLSLYMSLTIAMRAKESAAANVGPVRAATIAGDLIRQDLESVLPPTGTLAGQFVGVSQPAGSGRADQLEFYAVGYDGTPDNGPFAEGVRRIDLLVRTDLNPPVLVRQITRNLPVLAQQETQPEEEVLCRGVRSFTLRYFDGTTWQDEWDSTTVGDVLPLAIEMTLDLDYPNPRPGQATAPYRITRVFPLACAKPATDTTGGLQ
jgi:type II secretion system protein J